MTYHPTVIQYTNSIQQVALGAVILEISALLWGMGEICNIASSFLYLPININNTHHWLETWDSYNLIKKNIKTKILVKEFWAVIPKSYLFLKRTRLFYLQGDALFTESSGQRMSKTENSLKNIFDKKPHEHLKIYCSQDCCLVSPRSGHTEKGKFSSGIWMTAEVYYWGIL